MEAEQDDDDDGHVKAEPRNFSGGGESSNRALRTVPQISSTSASRPSPNWRNPG
jgi:hypothetical protein